MAFNAWIICARAEFSNVDSAVSRVLIFLAMRCEVSTGRDVIAALIHKVLDLSWY